MSADSALEFLDTNVLVYAHDTSAGRRRELALRLLDDLTARRAGAVSVQVLQEFFVTVTGKLPRPLPALEAARVVADLGALPTHAPDVRDVLAAIELADRERLSFWDAMILRSASQLNCALMWSEDLTAGGRYDGVEIRNPFA